MRRIGPAEIKRRKGVFAGAIGAAIWGGFRHRRTCLEKLMDSLQPRCERIQRALNLDKEDLTPSLKMIPRNVEKKCRKYIECVMRRRFDELPREAYVVDLA